MNSVGINLEQALYSKDETKQYVNYYKQSPRAFTPEQLNTLKQHVGLYNLPFAESEFDNSFNILRAVRAAGEGYLSGFTTMNIGEQPKSTGESIARSIGQLGGFVGWTPHRVLGLSAKLLGSTRLASAAVHARKMAGQSVPMYLSNKLTKGAKKAAGHIVAKGSVGGAKAVRSATNFLSGEVPSSLAESAFHLGTASAISSWQGGVKQMLSSFMHGATTGAVFGAIGNVEVGGPQADKAVRMVASSLYTGLPATMKGATTEEQVYEYLLGAYFGSTSKPSHYKKGAQLVQDSIKLGLRDPKQHKNFKNLSKKAQESAIKIYENNYASQAETNALVSMIAKKYNIPLLDAKALYTETKDLHRAQQDTLEGGDTRTVEGIKTKATLENPEAYPLHNDYHFPDIKDLYKLRQSNKDYIERNTTKWYADKNLTAKQLKSNMLNDALKLQEQFESTVNNKKSKSETRPYASIMNEFLVKDGYIKKPFEVESENGRYWTQKGILEEKGVHTKYYSPRFNENRGIQEVIGLEKGNATTPGGVERNSKRPVYEIEKLYDKIVAARVKRGIKTNTPEDILNVVDRIFVTKKHGEEEVKIYNANPKQIRFINENMRKRGLYPFSGRGTAHSLYYIPIHPDIEDMSQSQVSNHFSKMMRYAKKQNYRTKEGLRLDFNIFIEDQVGEGLYKQSQKVKTETWNTYRKQMLSNMLYDANTQGYENINEMETGHWVDSAIKFNKRQPILMSAGFEGDLSLIPKDYKKIDADGDAFMNVIYINDADKYSDQSKLHSGSRASEYLHATDGSFPVRPEIVNLINRISGKTQHGLEKSNTIGRNATLGTELGKNMTSTTHKDFSDWMASMDIDGFKYVSSTKQLGKRPVYDLEFVGGEGEGRYNLIDRNGKVEKILQKRDITPEAVKFSSFRHILGENMDISKDGTKTGFFKQAFTTVSPYFPHGFSKERVTEYGEIVEDIYDSLSRKGVQGNAKLNSDLYELIANPVEGKKLDNIIKNIDDVGLVELGAALRTNGAEKFVAKVLNKLIDRTSIHMQGLAQSGDISPEEYTSFVAQENILRNPTKRQLQWTQGSSMYTHPYTQPYIDSILQKYAYSRSVNPKAGNTYKQRMVRYGHELQNRKSKHGETYQLDNKSQKIEKGSMLHKMYGDIKSDQLVFFNNESSNSTVSFNGKKIKLGKVWKEFVSKVEGNAPSEELTPYKALFKTLNVRVPLSSTSGAQVLYFGGFTGIEGNGILVHPRSMELMDGADLDGDTATTFFGGREIHGKGLKSNWMKIYGDSSHEYYKTDKKTSMVQLGFNQNVPVGVIDGHRYRGKTILNTQPGERGALGNPYVANDAGGRYTRTEAVSKFKKDFLHRVDTDSAYKKWILSLTGKKIGYYKPTEKSIHLQVVLDYINKNNQGKSILTDAKNSIDIFDTLKRSYSEIHTLSDPAYLDYMNSRLSTWGPGARFRAAGAAARGREVLGVVVVTRAKLLATYSTLRGSNKSSFDIKDKKGFKHNYKLKLDAKNLQHFLETTRAQMALSSDPMNEAGLKTAEQFQEIAFKTLFEYTGSTKDGKSFTFDAPYSRKILQGDSLYKDIGSINKLIWGRNPAGRKYSGRDIHALLKNTMDKYTDLTKNTFLMKVAEDMQHVRMGVDILDKVDFKKFAKLLNNFNIKVSTDKDYLKLKELIKSDGLRIPFSPLFKDIIKSRIWEPDVHQEYLNSTNMKDPKTLKIYKWAKTRTKKGKSISQYDRISKYGEDMKALYRHAGNPEKRNYIISEVIRQARDWTSENLHTMSSARLIKNKMKQMDKNKVNLYIEKDGVKYSILHKLMQDADKLKSGSWLNSKYNEKEAKLYTAHELDAKIASMFDTITDPKIKKSFSELFDSILYGSFQSPEAIEAAGKLKDGKAYKTKMSRMAPTSAAIPDEHLQEAYGEYGKLYTSVNKGRQEIDLNTDVKIVDDFIKTVKTPKIKLKDVPEGKVIETELLIDQDKEYMEHRAWRILEGNVPTKLSKKWQPVLTELDKWLTKYENPATPWADNINDFFKSIIGKDMNQMDMVDFKGVNMWFKDLDSKVSWVEKGNKLDVSKGLPISPWFYYMFPKKVGEMLMKEGIELKPTQSAYQSKHGMVIGNVMKPTNVIETLQENFEKVKVNARQQVEIFRKDFSDSFEKYTIDNPDFEKLWQIMGIQQEANPRGLKMFTKGYSPSKTKETIATYMMRRQEVEKMHDWKNIKDKRKFKVNHGNGKIEILTGAEIIAKIKPKFIEQIKKNHTWLSGDGKTIKKFYYRNANGNYKEHEGTTIPIINFSRHAKDKNKSFFGWTSNHLHNNKSIPLEKLGMDGLEVVTRSMELQELGLQIDRIAKAAAKETDYKLRNGYLEQKKALEIHLTSLKKKPLLTTGKFDPDFFYPHVKNDPLLTAEWIRDEIYKVKTNPDLNKDQKSSQQKRLVESYARSVGGYQNMVQEDLLMNDTHIRSLLNIISESKKTRDERSLWIANPRKSKSQLSRTFHTPGWSLNHEDFISDYGESIISSYYNNISQIMAKLHINNFEKNGMKGWDPGIANAWSNWLRAYTQSSLGNPIVISDEIANDPKMHMKGVFSSWRDNHVAEIIDKAFNKLGLKKNKRMPEELSTLTEITPQKIVQWSNMEARYQLATLLAHPKSSMNNLFGGTMHTIESAGLSNLIKAKSLKHVQAAIDSNFKTWEDVNSWLRKMGIQEEFMVEEAKLNPSYKLIKQRGALKELTAAIMDGKKAEIPKILKKYKIGKTVFQKASWFMRHPETILRREAFLAHYMQALENLGGVVDDPKSNPYLIEMAKKGVKATQFLYSAPFRPLFSNTGLGKVMTRFQLWAWNSVRFRNDVLRDAKIAGYRPGSVDFERFKRTAMIDMFAIAAGNAFTYSLFETALPQPYAWFQDIADFLFGDSKEKDRAFFGAYPGYMAPLQMATPPSARMIGPTINALYSNDWSRLANYHVWTMFPFGRIGRDVVGIYKNPGMIVEKVSGLPYKKISRYKSQLDKNKIPSHHAMAIGYNKPMPQTNALELKLANLQVPH